MRSPLVLTFASLHDRRNIYRRLGIFLPVCLGLHSLPSSCSPKGCRHLQGPKSLVSFFPAPTTADAFSLLHFFFSLSFDLISRWWPESLLGPCSLITVLRSLLLSNLSFSTLFSSLSRSFHPMIHTRSRLSLLFRSLDEGYGKWL